MNEIKLENIPKQDNIEEAGISIAGDEKPINPDVMSKEEYEDLMKAMEKAMKDNWAERHNSKWRAKNNKKKKMAKMSRRKNR